MRKFLPIFFFIFLFSLIFTVSGDFNQDLGRHLKLGEIILREMKIPQTNLFSYTNKNFPFVDHHWLSEAVFYIMASLSGIYSLIFFKTFVIIASFFLLIFFSSRKNSFILTISLATLFAPLMLERADIRPEIFGYLIFSYMISVTLFEYKNIKYFYIFPLALMLWINLHISFVFGVFLLLIYIIKSVNYYRLKIFSQHKLLFLMLISFLFLLINPVALKGVFYPFSIFHNYGYSIVENQSIFFLWNLLLDPILKYFVILFPLYLLILVLLSTKRKFTEIIIFVVFLIISIKQIRHIPFFALTSIPIGAIAFRGVEKMVIRRISIKKEKLIFIGSIVISIFQLCFVFIFISGIYPSIFDRSNRFGFGYKIDAEKGADFLLKEKLPKNIFNNFDIGGYLIYKVYPEYEMFIDNRPEAYPKEFIQDVYIKLQYDPLVQKQIFNKYNIHTIFFAYTDQTPWAESFLKTNLNDLRWKIVFLDDAVVILTDESKYIDLRNKNNYLENMIFNQNDYLSLLRLTRLFSFMGRADLAEKAFYKASEINSMSCTVKINLANKYQSNPLTVYKANKIKSESWYCF